MSEISKLRYLWAVLRGPEVFRIHKTSQVQGQDYLPSSLESKSQFLINIFTFVNSMFYYTYPLWLPYCYAKGLITQSNLIKLGVYAGSSYIVYITAMFTRMIGRCGNGDYKEFLNKKLEYEKTYSMSSMKALKEYDFDFYDFPVEFQMNEDGRVEQQSSGLLEKILQNYCLTFPREIVAYVMAHTIGIRLAYPGATSAMNAIIGPHLLENRARLVEKENGRRGKLKSADGNFIDTMFVDKRSDNSSNTNHNGNTLVVCCEGNAGYYEVACMNTPMEKGYSVLGWNHPGFGASTGQPFPDAERNAIDVVMRYAIDKLGFPVENIFIFAWSIGGYTATLAGNMYPDIKGMLLDATFHDIVPFAKLYMPGWLESITVYTVRNYINLWNSKNLATYKGDVMMIRRLKDEVMNVGGPNNVKSSLGNLLIENFLWTRYPMLFSSTEGENPSSKTSLSERGEGDVFDALWSWLCEDTISSDWHSEEEFCLREIKSCMQIDEENWQQCLGKGLSQADKIKIVMFLLDKHVMNYDSSHCTQLLARYFVMPWNATAK